MNSAAPIENAIPFVLPVCILQAIMQKALTALLRKSGKIRLKRNSIMSMAKRRSFALLLLAGFAPAFGCAGLKAVGKGAVAPVAVVRDLVDAPLVSVTNAFEHFADNTSPAPTPRAGVGYTLGGGFNAGIGLDVSHYMFKVLSGVFGGVDYLVCRSICPNFPKGVSPWMKQEETWGDLYFPNTKALFRQDPPDHNEAQATPPRPAYR